MMVSIYLPEVKAHDGAAVDYSFAEKLSDCFDDFLDHGDLLLKPSQNQQCS